MTRNVANFLVNVFVYETVIGGDDKRERSIKRMMCKGFDSKVSIESPRIDPQFEIIIMIIIWA